jgi:hypothetical protein
MNDKPYTIHFEEREKYLYAFVTGEKDTLEISMMFWSEIAEKCRTLKCKKLLVEEDFPEAIQTFEMYRLAEFLAALRLSTVKTAFVDRRLEQQELNDFGLTVAQNRGLYAMIFNNAQEAEKWLLKS